MSERDSKGRFIKGEKPDSYIHGMKGSRIYMTWRNMKTRCLNPNCRNYQNYAGKGITIHEEWMEFLPFMEWAMKNGYEDHLTIERVDVDKGYSPSNCTFITMREQSRNKHLLTSANTSGYCGVNKTRHGRYIARVGDYILGKRICLGTFKSPIAAALVRDTYVLDNDLGLPLNFTYMDSL